MVVVEIGWGGLDRIGLAQARDKRRPLVKAVMSGYTSDGPWSSAQLQLAIYFQDL
jgi:hypothetical protein